MLSFPNCKINLGLHITRKRPDGYHDLETVFYPLPFSDALEMIPLESGDQPNFKTSGIPVPGDTASNLCVKAWQLLKKDFPQLPPVDIHLHKAIPMGAGLGGGSADGAFALRMLNELFELKLSGEQLVSYALQLGSDCPFFIINRPCYATGRGEHLEPLALDLRPYSLLIVNPGIHVSTAAAFAGIHPAPSPQSLKEIVQQPVPTWKQELKNDFEEPVFKLYPSIRAIKEKLYENGAIYAAMTGTGSTVYGLFDKSTTPDVGFPPEYFSRYVE